VIEKLCYYADYLTFPQQADCEIVIHAGVAIANTKHILSPKN